MGIAVQSEETSRPQRLERDLVVEVLTSGIAVDLHGDAPLRRVGKYRWPVRNDARPRARDPSAGVRQNADGRVLEGTDHPPCLVVSLSKTRVCRGKNEIERGGLAALEIKFAVGTDIGLHALQ